METRFTTDMIAIMSSVALFGCSKTNDEPAKDPANVDTDKQAMSDDGSQAFPDFETWDQDGNKQVTEAEFEQVSQDSETMSWWL